MRGSRGSLCKFAHVGSNILRRMEMADLVLHPSSSSMCRIYSVGGLNVIFIILRCCM